MTLHVLKVSGVITILRIPVCTLFNSHGTEDITAAGISPNAKEIVTVGDGKCQDVHFWLWTYGKDKPDGPLP